MMTPSNTWLREWTGPMTDALARQSCGLGQVPSALAPDAVASMVCGFCSTGCGLTVHLKEGQAVNLSPDPNYPVNLGMACPKGWESLAPLQSDDRLTTPMLRDRVTGRLGACDWALAMRTFCDRFKEILHRHGPESIAFLSTGQIATEEMAFLGALFKFGMGGVHCDSNTRQCMATSHVAYKQSFGFDAPPFAYSDFEESDVLVFIGSNLCVAHPILWQRVLRNRRSPRIIVIDPRRTETAMNATQHLALKPKSDLVLLYGTARALIERGDVHPSFIENHTTDFKGFSDFVQSFTPRRVCGATGLTPEAFDQFVSTIANGERVSFWWTMGVNQGHESTRTAQAIINLCLMTGNIGRPGTGPNSVTGQCNAMGSRLFANATSLLGGRDFANPAHREHVSSLLDLPLERIPDRYSLAYDQIIRRVADGRIKGLWIVGTNPSHSWIDRAKLRLDFDKLEFLAVQDMYSTTETARQAHLLLPAAGWGEKEGTMINSERRIGVVRKVSRAPGMALADFNIFKLVARYWGCADLFHAWSSPEEVFQILKRLSKGQPCDFSGIRDYAHLDACHGIQWPWPESRKDPVSNAETRPPEVERRLFEDGRFFTPDEKARFIWDAPREPAEKTCRDYPFTLLTGRGSSAQWHTLTRTGKSSVLRQLSPQACYVEIHPRDALAFGIEPGSRIGVASRRGEVEVLAQVIGTVAPGTIFMPMHFEETNLLTYLEVDPHSRQPSYKHAAVRLVKLGETAAS